MIPMGFDFLLRETQLAFSLQPILRPVPVTTPATKVDLISTLFNLFSGGEDGTNSLALICSRRCLESAR
jgi:hypothetical protein